MRAFILWLSIFSAWGTIGYAQTAKPANSARPAEALSACTILSQEGLGRTVLERFNQKPFSCQKNRVHLTFDDGPNDKVTPFLLDELSKRKVQATFFVTTTNLESDRQQKNRDIVARELKEGHTVASHGHLHEAYDLRIVGGVVQSGFTEQQRLEQVQKSKQLLDQATHGGFSKQKHLFYRFPYGRGAMPSRTELNHMAEKKLMSFSSNQYEGRIREYRLKSGALDTLGDEGFTHVGWNHDSRDSVNGVTDPTQYLLTNLEQLCDGEGKPGVKIALFHDIKTINKEAIPLLIDLGKCLGLDFISSNQMMKESALAQSGIIVNRNEDAKITLTESVKKIENINAILNKPEKCEQKSPSKTCKSENGRVYQDCEGEESICFEGGWYNKKYHEVFLKQRCPDQFKSGESSSY